MRKATYSLPRPSGRSGEAKALNNLGLVAHRLGDYAIMRERLEQCLPIYLELHEDTLAARVLNNLGLVLTLQKEYDAAHKFLTDSLDSGAKTGRQKQRGECAQ